MLSVKEVQQALGYFCERGSLVGVHPQAPLSQARVLGVGGMASLGEMGEEWVGERHPGSADDIGLLPRVESPHQHAKGVGVGPSGDLQRWKQQAQGSSRVGNWQ